MRYLKLYIHFLRFSFSKAMEFRFDFTFRIIMDIVYYGVNLLFFKLLYLHTPLLGGWNESQIMVFVGGYLFVDALNMTVFSSNMWWLPAHINKGDLDYYLIRPVSPLFFLTLREFSANSFMNLVIAAGILIAALLNYPSTIGVGDLLVFIALLINGSILYCSIQLLMILPVFWTHSPRGFSDLFYSMCTAMERPDKIYVGWTRKLFTILIPFSLIASFPAKLFIEGLNWKTLGHLAIVTIGIYFLVGLVWKWGLRNYSSASS